MGPGTLQGLRVGDTVEVAHMVCEGLQLVPRLLQGLIVHPGDGRQLLPHLLLEKLHDGLALVQKGSSG